MDDEEYSDWEDPDDPPFIIDVTYVEPKEPPPLSPEDKLGLFREAKTKINSLYYISEQEWYHVFHTLYLLHKFELFYDQDDNSLYFILTELTYSCSYWHIQPVQYGICYEHNQLQIRHSDILVRACYEIDEPNPASAVNKHWLRALRVCTQPSADLVLEHRWFRNYVAIMRHFRPPEEMLYALLVAFHDGYFAIGASASTLSLRFLTIAASLPFDLLLPIVECATTKKLDRVVLSNEVVLLTLHG